MSKEEEIIVYVRGRSYPLQFHHLREKFGIGPMIELAKKGWINKSEHDLKNIQLRNAFIDESKKDINGFILLSGSGWKKYDELKRK